VHGRPPNADQTSRLTYSRLYAPALSPTTFEGTLREIAGNAQRLQVGGIVGPSEQNGVDAVDVADVVGADAADLAGSLVTEQNLRPDLPPPAQCPGTGGRTGRT
jgi:hypothetical protein